MGVCCTGIYVYFTSKLNGMTEQVLASLQTLLQP
jgi:type VI secretion system protein ImpK